MGVEEGWGGEDGGGGVEGKRESGRGEWISVACFCSPVAARGVVRFAQLLVRPDGFCSRPPVPLHAPCTLYSWAAHS